MANREPVLGDSLVLDQTLAEVRKGIYIAMLGKLFRKFRYQTWI